jgi:transcriptional regulator with XRE-family HTH domain
MKDRIAKVISHESITPSKFADIIGVQRSSISHILSGRNNPGLDFLNKILIHFPHISGDWLITGQGDMLKKAANPFKMPSLFDKSSSPKEMTLPPKETSKVEPKSLETDVSIPAITNEINAESRLNLDVKANAKSIERIIVFYSDKSFREYLPE